MNILSQSFQYRYESEVTSLLNLKCTEYISPLSSVNYGELIYSLSDSLHALVIRPHLKRCPWILETVCAHIEILCEPYAIQKHYDRIWRSYQTYCIHDKSYSASLLLSGLGIDRHYFLGQERR